MLKLHNNFDTYCVNMSYGECAICYNYMELTPLVCGHAFCRGCIHQWYIKKKSCAYCKQPTLINSHCFQKDYCTKILDLSSGTSIGVTVQQQKNGNLRIKSVKKNGQFHKSGYKRGLIIEELNGLKYDVNSFIKALEFANEKKQNVYLTMQSNRYNKGQRLWKSVLKIFW